MLRFFPEPTVYHAARESLRREDVFGAAAMLVRSKDIDHKSVQGLLSETVLRILQLGITEPNVCRAQAAFLLALAVHCPQNAAALRSLALDPFPRNNELRAEQIQPSPPHFQIRSARGSVAPVPTFIDAECYGIDIPQLGRLRFRSRLTIGGGTSTPVDIQQYGHRVRSIHGTFERNERQWSLRSYHPAGARAAILYVLRNGQLTHLLGDDCIRLADGDLVGIEEDRTRIWKFSQPLATSGTAILERSDNVSLLSAHKAIANGRVILFADELIVQPYAGDPYLPESTEYHIVHSELPATSLRLHWHHQRMHIALVDGQLVDDQGAVAALLDGRFPLLAPSRTRLRAEDGDWTPHDLTLEVQFSLTPSEMSRK